MCVNSVEMFFLFYLFVGGLVLLITGIGLDLLLVLSDCPFVWVVLLLDCLLLCLGVYCEFGWSLWELWVVCGTSVFWFGL